jgi:phage tail sheath protein FI
MEAAMPQYLAPGVYVEEVPSGGAPIAGVSTSTAGFIGLVPDALNLLRVENEAVGTGDGTTTEFNLARYPIATEGDDAADVFVDGTAATGATVANEDTDRVARVTFAAAPAAGAHITVSYTPRLSPPAVGQALLCTTWADFTRNFGDFTLHATQRLLAHAVYGFFNNGGGRCYVARAEPPTGGAAPNIQAALDTFEGIDEIALVAAPGVTDDGARAAIVTHCRIRTGDRFGIFDSPRDLTNDDLTRLAPGGADMPDNTDYAAFYFPWLQVTDPATNAPLFVPPSGHMAGVYARTDEERGVHKSPANTVVYGVTGLRYRISRRQQEGMNPQGVNVIRDLNGNIRVWGARTIGGDANGEWRYISVRRLFLFLRESIDEGTQWTVFEPNTSVLWARIRMNVSAFLRNVWADGALFGDTPEQAFYVKCDEETNPPEVRDAGRVVTEIGVRVTEPAEFVIFRISQWAGPPG